MLNDAIGFNRIFISCGFTDLRRADRIKALVYEGDGFVLAYKRLSNGRYQWPRNVEVYVYKELEYQPARFVVREHHIAVYAGNGDTGVIRADRPDRLLKNSILTTSLAAGIFEEKYVNHSPYNRIEASFKCKDANIARQNMAGWMIMIYDRYLRPLRKEFQKELLKSKLIHCDESPFKMPDKGREPKQVPCSTV